MATRLKELQDLEFILQDGFSGTSAVNDAAIAASDTVIGVDTHALRDARTVVPVGARFTTAGIATVRTVTATQGSTQYTIDTTASTAGTFTVTHNGNTTSAIAYDATTAAVQTALEALASIGAGNVVVTGAPQSYTVTFAGTLKNTEQTITVDGSGLTAVNSHVLTKTQDGTTTWEVTFTPALVAGSIPADDDVITWYPRRVSFEVETGNLAWTEGANPIARKSRGLLNGLRKGDEQEMTVETAFEFTFLRAQTTATDPITATTPYEVLHQEGFASDWLSSSHGGVCDPYTIDLVVIDRPKCGSEQAEIMIFPQFAFTSINPNVNDGVVNLSGMCPFTKPIITRVANNEDAIGVVF